MSAEHTPREVEKPMNREALQTLHGSVVEFASMGTETMMEMQALLEGKTVSQKLTEFLLKKICSDEACTNATTFPTGTLITEGMKRNSCFLVLPDERGIKISKTVHHPDYGDIVLDLGTIDGPTVLGEIALFGDGRATASVELTRLTRAIELSYTDLVELLDQDQEEGKEIEVNLRKIAAERIVETIERISRAEDEFRRAANEKTRQKMRETFSFARAKKALEGTGSKTVLGSFTLTGEDDEGNTKDETFTAIVHQSMHTERVRTSIEQRTPLGYVLPFLGRSATHRTVYRHSDQLTVKPESVTVTVHPQSKPEASITTIEYSEHGKKAYVAGTYSEKLGLGNMKFVGQIYREAFSEVEEIDTTFQEHQTVRYAYEHGGSETRMAPSAWGAHSSVIAARKGFVTEAHQIMPSSVWARSYKVDRELDGILTVLRHIERVCIASNDRVYGRAHMPRQKFSKLYERIEIKDALSWAEEALKKYLAEYREKLRPEVQKLMDMQTKRIAELWQEHAVQSDSVEDL